MSSSSNSFDKKYPYGRCQMRSATGDPCRMPALHGERCCHYHKVMGKTTVRGADEFLSYDHIYLPRLDDAPAIQAAISEVCELMLHGRIEPKEASALFYAMQVASQNLSPLNATSYLSKTGNGEPAAANPETSDSAANSPTTPDRLPPGTIQACADQPVRRRRGRPRKAVPLLVRSS